MHVIRACHVIHSLQRGGAEHLLVDLAAVAPEVGVHLSVVSLMPLEGHAYAGELRGRGVDVRGVDLPTRWDPRGLQRGAAAIAATAPDVVHTHLKHADLVGAWAAARLGVPMVSTLHLIEDAVSRVGRAKRWAAAQARLRRAARTITVSDAQRDWYLGAFPGADADRVVTVRNGVAPPPAVEPAERERLRAELGAGPDQVLAVMVGIMRPAKGHAELLDAARRLPDDGSITFALLGDGPLRGELEATAAARGGAPVVFAGFRDDVARVLAAADLVVHPSLAEALPTALIHALGAGVPSVASDVGGIPEVVTPEAGVLVPAGDGEALAREVADLASDADRRRALGAGARRRFDQEFDVRRWAERLRAVYDDVLPG